MDNNDKPSNSSHNDSRRQSNSGDDLMEGQSQASNASANHNSPSANADKSNSPVSNPNEVDEAVANIPPTTSPPTSLNMNSLVSYGVSCSGSSTISSLTQSNHNQGAPCRKQTSIPVSRLTTNSMRANRRFVCMDLLNRIPNSKANREALGAAVAGCSTSSGQPSMSFGDDGGVPMDADMDEDDDDDDDAMPIPPHLQHMQQEGMQHLDFQPCMQPALPALPPDGSPPPMPPGEPSAARGASPHPGAAMLMDHLANPQHQQPPIGPQPQMPDPGDLAQAGQPHVVPYNWQASKTSVKERLAYMFNNEVMADVHFLVGKGHAPQRIPAHRFVLSTGSAVFDAMFYGGMATKSETVELPDVEPAAFLALLRFLYSDEVQIGPETVMTTLYTAKKYAVPALEKACVDFLKCNLSSDNAFMLLTQARLFDEPQLATLCLETIDKNTTEALAAEGFLDIDLETLCVVLARDTLGIRECKLFLAACRWAEAECHRRHVAATADQQRMMLGRALQLVRFPLMTVEEFAVGAAQSKILTDREVVELFLHFTVNPKPSVGFLDVPRCCLTGKEQVVSRFLQIESRWGYSGTSDRIRFMVNRRIFVVGFGLYGSIHGPSEYQVQIQVIHTDTGKVCGHNDSSFQCDGANSTFRVMFKEPVEVQANTNYTACTTLKGPDSYYGTKGLRKVTHESVTSGKVTFHFTYAAGNNNGTSVEDGQIPEIIFYRYK